MPVIYLMTLAVPVLVLPGIVDNAFNTPKNLVLFVGAALMAGLYAFQYLRGKEVPSAKSATSRLLVGLVLLNLFNLLYTQNDYYSIHAASLNIACLLVFYFLSIRVNGNRALRIVAIAAFAGVLVSVVTYLQFTGHFILFKWAHKGIMVMGTIGNSNYLGAYLVFPLFAVVSLIFLLKGPWRLLPVAVFIFMLGAFFFTRARAGWFGFFLSLPVFLWLMARIHRFRVLPYLRAYPRRVATGAILAIVLLASLWFAAPDRLHNMMDPRQVTRSDTLRLRIQKYYAGSWWLFKQSPLFGTGLWSFRNRVYWAQAEIEKKNPGFFEDYAEPKPRRVHTEYLEILNDGGVVAAAALALFLVIVLRHGWRVIRQEDIPVRDRTLAAMAFCSLIAILLASVFFFSFRINSTLFMTVLMMGILEGLYLNHNGLITSTQGWRGASGGFLIPVVVLVLVGWVWYTGIKPFRAEQEHWQYKMSLQKRQLQEAEAHLIRAVELDPHNTAYCTYAAQFYTNALRNFPEAGKYLERAILDFNGDITRWSIFFMKGVLKFQSGALFEAREAFEQALYFNPKFEPAQQKLQEVNQVIQTHDRVMIKIR
jgi:O-antigen ligase